jgi:hypothetical protein
MFSRKILFLLLFSPFLLKSQTLQTAKPWAYWWWLGSAVDSNSLSKNLQTFAEAGFGGMHIIPIYGVKGEESKFIPYLSPKWVEMLDYTVLEARRLGLGIDMTLGTGWPLGGRFVTETDAAKAFKIRKAETGKWVLDVAPTQQKVKRAAPGGEGWVLDHFNETAVLNYFKPYDSLFSKKNIGVRAFYNDSYEVYGANWTNDFFKKFQKHRGYDLAQHLDVLALDSAKTEREKRIWADYHQTLSDLLLTDLTQPLNAFAHKYGKILRNESHGSPANILDLYGASDVPESEFFGSKPYNIPLYRQDEAYDPRRFGKPGAFVLKFASSAAAVMGKKLVSSETATWLGNHFKVSLSQVKPIVDESFVGGVNHIFYHGVPYSPPDAPFPGWLFYASTNFNPQSHFWKELPLLNGYIERCQQLLQPSQPDNDVLLYMPLVDWWHAVGKKDKTHVIDVHTLLSSGIYNSPFGNLANQLTKDGYGFDFVSDRQLQNAQGNKKGLTTEGGAQYRAVLIPPVEYIPLETVLALEKLQKAGVLIVFSGKLPRSVNGFWESEKRAKQLATVLKKFVAHPQGYTQVFENQRIRKENLDSKGLQFIRKKTPTSTLYFIVNPEQTFSNGKIELSTTAASVQYFDPLSQTKRWIPFQKIGKNKILIPLNLRSGESVFIETFPTPQPQAATQNAELRIPNAEIPLSGSWQVDFLKGAPSLPQGFKTEKLTSWTSLSPDTMAQYFSGTARYRLTFNALAHQTGKAGRLDLGDVRESAVVKLNGKTLGTAWSLPYHVPIPAGLLLKDNNQLEIEVTNLSANRIRWMDKKAMLWRKFYDINFVDISYKPFDASGWQPVPSGLLGEVRLLTW